MSERLWVSASQIEDYLMCELSWRHRRDHTPKLPFDEVKMQERMDVGSMVHKVMHWYHQRPLETRSADALGALTQHALEGQESEWVREKVLGVCRRFWKKFGADEERSGSIYLPEHEVRVELPGNVGLVGYLDDLLVHEDGTADIGEYKTHLSRPDFESKMLWNVQVPVYVALAEMSRPVEVESVTFTHLLTEGVPKRMRLWIGPAHREWIEDSLPEILRRMLLISKGDKPIWRLGWPCKRCPYSYRCEERLTFGTEEGDLDEGE